MVRKLPIFYSALLLTGANLMLRMVGTSFQVYLSGRIGPAGIGLLQLVMSVNSLALIVGMAGIRTAAMYLTAEELGKGKPGNVSRILSGCFVYSVLASGTAAAALYCAAPMLAGSWIGNPQTVPALRLFALFLPTVCLCGVMTGYFTAANRIGTLAAVEAAEQLCAMGAVMTALTWWAGDDPARACQAVVLGNSLGAVLTLVCLLLLRLAEDHFTPEPIPVRSRLLRAAVPLAIADTAKSGINTTENLMVPKRLARFPGTDAPLAAFGMVSGMVFPVLMFPACILFSLAELLIPEMARCAASGNRTRIRYLAQRSLRLAMLYGICCSGILYLAADWLCGRLYGSKEAGAELARYALLVPVLYCDAVTDAMTKGLGQQKICVRYNILTSAMDAALLYILLPRLGMDGYFLSFLVAHLLNFLLSLKLLCRISGIRLPFHIPALSVSAGLMGGWMLHSLPGVLGAALFLPVLVSLLTLLQVVSRDDLRWMKGLILGKAQRRKVRTAQKSARCAG